MSQALLAYAAGTTFVLCCLGAMVSWFFLAYYCVLHGRGQSLQSQVAVGDAGILGVLWRGMAH
jgi:hypothetical protein